MEQPALNRPQCSAFLGMSLDGYIARRNGALDWLEAFHRPDEEFGYESFRASIDTILLGRGTYDVVCGFSDWPYQGKRVVVLTHNPTTPRCDETFASGALPNVLHQLHLEGSKHVYVDGGNLVRQSLEAGCLDAMILTIVPYLLGNGIPLFGGMLCESALSLETSQAFGSGVVQLRYTVKHTR